MSESNKKCQRCGSKFEESNFTEGDRVYSCCKKCRLKYRKTEDEKILCLGGCGKRPFYNYKGETKGAYCVKHKHPDMVSIKGKSKCQHAGCKKQPAFNNLGEKGGLFCAEHKEPSMVNVKHKTCQHPSCKKIPNFNNIGEKVGLFCAQHKELGMVDVKNKTCQYTGCKKLPIFNNPGEKVGVFCAQHKGISMVNVKDKTCQNPDCKKKPCFNNPGEKVGLFCAQHKEVGMVNVKHKTCQYTGCKKLPIFNNPEEKTGVFCAQHKGIGMVDVKNKTCQHPECNKQPAFNNSRENVALFCAQHKEVGMVNVKHKTCQHPECKKIPTFNNPEEKTGVFCAQHKEVGMVNVKNKMCEKCPTRPSYGIPGNPPTLCTKHAKGVPGIIKNPSKHCSECSNTATYGIKEPVHCEEHKDEHEENLCQFKCKNEKCGLVEPCNKEGICLEYCVNSELFQKHRHLKELRVKKLLEAEITIESTHDKIVDSSCNRRRPDFLYDVGTHNVIVEIDENQHKGNEPDCEKSRMLQLYHALGMEKLIFIRYNPDEFKDENGKKSKITRAAREEKLASWVKYMLEKGAELLNEENQSLKVMYICYDGFDGTNPKEEYLDPYGKNEC